jgi:hypothetical protein
MQYCSGTFDSYLSFILSVPDPKASKENGETLDRFAWAELLEMAGTSEVTAADPPSPVYAENVRICKVLAEIPGLS